VTKILAIDLGNRKSVACDYQCETGVHEFVSVATTPISIRALVEKRRPDRVVIEWQGDPITDALKAPVG